MSIVRAIKNNHFELIQKRGWDKVYYAFDIHGTILKPNYEYGNTPSEFYPYAKETLQFISSLPDVVMILYTCSHPHEFLDFIDIVVSPEAKK